MLFHSFIVYERFEPSISAHIPKIILAFYTGIHLNVSIQAKIGKSYRGGQEQSVQQESGHPLRFFYVGKRIAVVIGLIDS